MISATDACIATAMAIASTTAAEAGVVRIVANVRSVAIAAAAGVDNAVDAAANINAVIAKDAATGTMTATSVAGPVCSFAQFDGSIVRV